MAQMISISNSDQKTIVSEMDQDLAAYKWYLRSNTYVARGIHVKNQNTQIVLMHRLIMQRILQRDLLRSEIVRHFDENTLNNQRDNLRKPYLGVRNSGFHWIAEITYQNQIYNLGSYNSIEEAAYVYNQKAIELFGQNATINLLVNSDQQPQKQFKNAYKGVYYHQPSRKWKAHIGYNYKDYCIGYYDSAEQAALAYNEKAIELHGPNAKINFIQTLFLK